MDTSFKEANYEQSIIELFEKMGYTHVYGPQVDRDFHEPLMLGELRYALEKVNSNLPQAALDEALYKIKNYEAGSLVSKNETFMDYLQNGVEVSYQQNGETKSSIVYLVDYEHPFENSFIVANQWTIEEYEVKRPDILIFLNGIPVVLMELKSPKADEVTIQNAYNQIQNYKKSIESTFIYNAFCIISDQTETRAGTITANFERFMEWKTVDGNYENTQYADFTTLFYGMFEKTRFLDIIKNFICFSKDNGNDAKILAAYHQYFAVKKAVESTLRASSKGGDGRGGVFWHTQGSGKSLSMVFYAHLLQKAMDSPTLVVITDRNDLDDQLYSQFAKCKDFLRQTPIHADKRKLSQDEIDHGSKLIGLMNWLDGREANGIIFSTMQKFEESDEPLSTRHNIVVMADEAHRSQYGLGDKVTQDGKLTIGNARRVRDALPNATYIGFTGTPIALDDRNTVEVFGDYIDIYDMTQAVEDGATVPIYYESRVVKLKLDQDVLDQIDKKYGELADEAEPGAIEKSKHELSKLEVLLDRPEVIQSLVSDIIDHYENNRQYIETGKAMIVGFSRKIAIDIYYEILKERPSWNKKVAVIMTGSNQDPPEWKDLIGNKQHKEDLAREFKDNSSELKIAIVVDMWLTGFDVPSMSTMYIFKPMKGHNLMQAIARVNRVYKDKAGGLIVDYIGLASALKKAMRDYTKRDQKNYGDMDVSKTAYKKFQEKLIVCEEQFYGYDYSKFLSTDSDLERAKLISGGVNFLLDPSREETKKNFLTESYVMRQAFSLSKSLATEDERKEEAYFDTVRSVINKIGSKGKLKVSDINKQISELLQQTVHSDGVINLFSDVDKEFNIFDSAFMTEISKMPEKNTAVELLKKLISEQVHIYQRTNLVKSQQYSDLLNRTMNSYLNGMITNEEVIDELLKMAKEMSEADSEKNSLGLTDEEMAFYDALTRPEAVKDFYTNDQLIGITKELTAQLRKSRTIDWEKKESARAGMRRMVKRLLKKYKYPPEGYEEALQTVLKQCEMWTDNYDESEG